MNKFGILRKMAEYDQNTTQRVSYLRHNIRTLLDKNVEKLFDIWAVAHNIYYMMLQDEFDLIRYKYQDYMIIVQNTNYEWVIEMRKNGIRQEEILG